RMKWSDWINEEGEIMNAQDTTTAFFNRLKAREEGASGDFFRYVEDYFQIFVQDYAHGEKLNSDDLIRLIKAQYGTELQKFSGETLKEFEVVADMWKHWKYALDHYEQA